MVRKSQLQRMHGPVRRSGRLLCFLAGLVLLLAPAQQARGQGAPQLTLALLASGLDQPLDIANTGVAGDARLFVAEKNGTIRIVTPDGAVSGPFLDLSAVVSGGLLGLTFHPDYAANGYFFVKYHGLDSLGVGETRIVRYEVDSANPALADPASAQVILAFRHACTAAHALDRRP